MLSAFHSEMLYLQAVNVIKWSNDTNETKFRMNEHI